MSGWQSMTLGEVMQLEYGKPLAPSDRNPHGLYPAYGANGEKDRTDKFFRDQPSIIVGRKGSAGEITLTEEKYWPLDVTYFAEFDRQRYYLKFLYYLLTTLNLPSLAKGVKPGINRNELYALQVMIPPLTEQRRIVAILDEAFEGIIAAKTNAEKNRQNARALFDSYLQSVFSKRGDGWVEKPLGALCEVKDGTHESPKYVDVGIPFVTQKNIRDDGLSLENTKFIRQEDHANFYRRSNAACGDILISMIGANRGMACIVDDEVVFSIKNVGLVKQSTAVDQKFLFHFLKSPQATKHVQSVSKGGAQEFVGLTELRKFPVPIPSLKHQKLLAEKFQLLRDETHHLESLYRQKLTALENLKTSLLYQAFSGAL